MSDDYLLSIASAFAYDGDGEDAVIIDDWLHVECGAANAMWFDIRIKGLDLYGALNDLCAILPVMMRLDSDLAEMYDDAGRTQPKREDRIAWQRFLNGYGSRIIRGQCALPGCDGWDMFPYQSKKKE